MYKATCIICSREFVIPASDRRYKDIKYGRKVRFICDRCSMATQNDAVKATGINPEDVDRSGHR